MDVKFHPQYSIQGKKAQQKTKEIPEAYNKVAEGMESQFANYLIQQMRKTVQRDKPLSSAEAYYQSIMDNEISKTMSESEKGLGIKKVILEQILPNQYKPSKVNAFQAKNESIETYKKPIEITPKGEGHE